MLIKSMAFTCPSHLGRTRDFDKTFGTLVLLLLLLGSDRLRSGWRNYLVLVGWYTQIISTGICNMCNSTVQNEYQEAGVQCDLFRLAAKSVRGGGELLVRVKAGLGVGGHQSRRVWDGCLGW